MHYSINCCGKPIFVTKEEVDAQLEKFGKCAVKCAACRNVWYFDQSRDKFTKERDEAFRGAKPPITPKSSGKKVPLAPAEKINWGKIVSIQVDHGQVQEMAYALSQSGKSHDDLVWLYAEAELRLKPAYIVGNSNKDDDDEKTVELDSNVIVAQPSEEEIRAFAEGLAAQNLSDQTLHWYIAERNYLFEQVKQS